MSVLARNVGGLCLISLMLLAPAWSQEASKPACCDTCEQKCAQKVDKAEYREYKRKADKAARRALREQRTQRVSADAHIPVDMLLFEVWKQQNLPPQ